MQHQMRSARHRLIAASSLVALFAAVPASAQDVTIVPKLRAGDSFQLDVIRIFENSARPEQNGRSTTRVDVRVLSTGAEGFVVEWVPGVTVFDNPQVALNAAVSSATALRDMRLELDLSADGELRGVANEVEIAPKLKMAVDGFVNELAAGFPEQERKSFLDLIGQGLSPEVLIDSATRDAATYLALNGMELSVGEALGADVEQPSPLGGGPIPGKFRVVMESVTADVALLKTTTTHDAAALLSLTESFAKQMGAPIPPEELAGLPPMEMTDDGTFVFDQRRGLMREVKVNRRIVIGPSRRLEAWEIRLVE